MFTNEAAILQAAATLAAAHHTLKTEDLRTNRAPYTDSPTDALLNVLREMESKKLIGPGLVPPRR